MENTMANIMANTNRDFKYFLFRDKTIDGWGGKYSAFGNKYIKFASKGYMELFNTDAFLQPSCYNCKFANEKRHTDITISDYWSIEKVNKDFSDSLGVSCIIANSKKGLDLVNKLYCTGNLIETKFEDAIQNPLVKPSSIPSNRKELLDKYNKGGIRSLLADQKIIKIVMGIPLTTDTEFLKVYIKTTLRQNSILRFVKDMIR